MEKEELFELIAESAIYGNLGLFIGAGFPKAVSQIESDWTFNPYSWSELLKRVCFNEDVSYKDIIAPNLADKLSAMEVPEIDISDYVKFINYPEIATEICKIISEKDHCEYKDAVKKLKVQIAHIVNQFPNKAQRHYFFDIFEKIAPKWIVTTNYDHVIESLIPQKTISVKPGEVFQCEKDKIPVYHLHGTSTTPETIIITSEDYQDLYLPHDYRMDKMTLLFKESTTLMLGYGIGDPNVKTALDWSRNIYKTYEAKYSEKIIQFAYSIEPNSKVIEDGKLYIYETSSLSETLRELSEYIAARNKENEEKKAKILDLNEKLKNADDDFIIKFLSNNDGIKTKLYELILKENTNIILQDFLDKIFGKLMNDQQIYNNFEGYKNNLEFTIDLLKNIPLNMLSPMSLNQIIKNLDGVITHLGKSIGDAHAATDYWIINRHEIPKDTYNVIKTEVLTKSEGGVYSYKWKTYL